VKKNLLVYLSHILERVDRIIQFTRTGRDTFFGYAMVQDAVVRNLEVIGEAAKRIPDDYRVAHHGKQRRLPLTMFERHLTLGGVPLGPFGDGLTGPPRDCQENKRKQ